MGLAAWVAFLTFAFQLVHDVNGARIGQSAALGCLFAGGCIVPAAIFTIGKKRCWKFDRTWASIEAMGTTAGNRVPRSYFTCGGSFVQQHQRHKNRFETRCDR